MAPYSFDLGITYYLSEKQLLAKSQLHKLQSLLGNYIMNYIMLWISLGTCVLVIYILFGK